MDGSKATVTRERPEDVVYVDADPRDYQVSPETIRGWAKTFNDAKISEHGWRVWAAITKETGQILNGINLPIWETWFSEWDLFPPPQDDKDKKDDKCVVHKGPYLRPYHQINQSGLTDALSFNKYNLPFKNYIYDNKLNDVETLFKANTSFNEKTPIRQRTIDNFLGKTAPLDGIMLKPTYWAVKRGQVSPLPYWKDAGLKISGTVNPRKPTDRTWTQIVLVNDTGKPVRRDPQQIIVYPDSGPRTIKLIPDKVVTVKDFYAVPLTEGDIDFIRCAKIFQFGGVEAKDLKPGDWALLVAMHATTVEWENWTWQTFWWTPFPKSPTPKGVRRPWTNYNMASAYYMTDKNGKPHIAFNPHLETPIVGATYMNQSDRGADSNCMTCHRVAAFPTINSDPAGANFLLGSYKANGLVTGNEQYFRNRLQTVFMWTPVLQNQISKKYEKNYKNFDQ